MQTKKNNMNKFYDDYEDSGLCLIAKPVIYVPRFFEDLMSEINEKKHVDITDEYSLYAIAKISGFVIRLTQGYFIPLQTVHGAETDNCENRPNKHYNTVMHRHPDCCNNFSGGDETYINRNFDVSLLWTVKDGFVKGRFNMYAKRMRLALDCEIIIQRPPIKVKGINKIKKHITKTKGYKGYSLNKDYQYPLYNDNEDDYTDTLYNIANTRDKDVVKNDNLIDSQVIDNSGNLVKYGDGLYGDDDTDNNWFNSAIEFIEAMQLTDRDKKDIDMRSFELLSILDKYDAGYRQEHSKFSNEFLQMTNILAFAEHWWGWREELGTQITEELVANWLDGHYDLVYAKLKRVFQALKNNIELTLTKDG